MICQLIGTKLDAPRTRISWVCYQSRVHRGRSALNLHSRKKKSAELSLDDVPRPTVETLLIAPKQWIWVAIQDDGFSIRLFFFDKTIP